MSICNALAHAIGGESLPNAPLRAQVVTDEMWAARGARWPGQPPATREYFLLRSIFEEHFPSPSALATVPTVCPPATKERRSALYLVLPI